MFRFEDDPLSSLVLLSNDPLPAARCPLPSIQAYGSAGSGPVRLYNIDGTGASSWN